MKPEEIERLDCCTVLTGIAEMLRNGRIGSEQAAELIDALERKCGHIAQSRTTTSNIPEFSKPGETLIK